MNLFLHLLAITPALPGEVRVDHIDASPLGMVVGGVVTGVAVALIFIVVGWALVKWKVVTIGTPMPIIVTPAPASCPAGEATPQGVHYILPDACANCARERLLSSQHETQIGELFGKWNSVRDSMGAMAVDIGVIKAGIEELQKRRRGATRDD